MSLALSESLNTVATLLDTVAVAEVVTIAVTETTVEAEATTAITAVAAVAAAITAIAAIAAANAAIAVAEALVVAVAAVAAAIAAIAAVAAAIAAIAEAATEAEAEVALAAKLSPAASIDEATKISTALEAVGTNLGEGTTAAEIETTGLRKLTVINVGTFDDADVVLLEAIAGAVETSGAVATVATVVAGAARLDINGGALTLHLAEALAVAGNGALVVAAWLSEALGASEVEAADTLNARLVLEVVLPDGSVATLIVMGLVTVVVVVVVGLTSVVVEGGQINGVGVAVSRAVTVAELGADLRGEAAVVANVATVALVVGATVHISALLVNKDTLVERLGDTTDLDEAVGSVVLTTEGDAHVGAVLLIVVAELEVVVSVLLIVVSVLVVTEALDELVGRLALAALEGSAESVGGLATTDGVVATLVAVAKVTTIDTDTRLGVAEANAVTLDGLLVAPGGDNGSESCDSERFHCFC